MGAVREEAQTFDVSGIPARKIAPTGTEESCKGYVSLLGNAYGVLSYQAMLADGLAREGYEA